MLPGSSPLRWCPGIGAADNVDVEEDDVVGVSEAEELVAVVTREDTEEQEEEFDVNRAAAAPESTLLTVASLELIFLVASLARHFSGVLLSGEVPKR